MALGEKINISTFIKFGSEKNIRDLYENGTIFCKTIDYFKKVDDNYLRGDKFEGAESIYTYANGEIKKFELFIASTKERIGTLHPTWAQLIKYRHCMLGNLYCMYTIKPEDVPKNVKFKIDILNRQFGTHFLLVNNNQQFIERIIKALIDSGYEFAYDVVRYFDSKFYTGHVNHFQKRNEYSYQKEFRFLIHNQANTDILLKLGSIKDISTIFETKDLELIDFRKMN